MRADDKPVTKYKQMDKLHIEAALFPPAATGEVHRQQAFCCSGVLC